MSSEPSDDLAALAARALTAYRAGDATDMGPLVERLAPILWRLARSQGLDAETAQDVVQMTWVRLVQSIDQILDPQSTLKWLLTTTRREAWNQARQRSRATVTDPTLLPDPPEHEHEDRPDELAVRREERALVWRHVRRLTPRCQALLGVIAFADRPDYHAVSEALGMPLGSIGPTRGRCLAKLRVALESDPAWTVRA